MTKITTLIATYILVFIIGFVAKLQLNGYPLDFLWIVYLPFATSVSIITFDLINKTIDFDLINQFKEENKAVYTVALAILSAGFAIATAIFLK